MAVQEYFCENNVVALLKYFIFKYLCKNKKKDGFETY